MAYSSIGHMGFALVGLAAGTVEGAQGVLVYIAIYVAMTLGTFAVILSMRRNGQHGREHQRFRRPVAHQSAAGVLLRDAAVLAGRHSAARGLLREILRVRRRDQGRAVHARRGRRARQRGGRLLLSHHHQGDVFRRAGSASSIRCAWNCARCWRSRASSTSSSSSIRGRWSASPRPRRSRCSRRCKKSASKRRCGRRDRTI
jgi:hypothetical protein